MNDLVDYIVPIASLLTVIAIFFKMKPEVRSLNVATNRDQYELDERRRTEQREAEQRLADTVSEMVKNLSESYQGLLQTVNASHDKVVNGMRTELVDVSERLKHVEALLMRERATATTLNTTIEGLNTTVSGLNEALSERDGTIRRIRARLNETQGINIDGVIADGLAHDRRTDHDDTRQA